MTGADNPDQLYKPSKVFAKWAKEAEKWQHYPHIPILTTNARLRRSLLGLHLNWTIKEDGQNVTIWQRTKPYCKKKQELVISSHNQEIASSDIQNRVGKTCITDFANIVDLINDNPTFRVSAEECAKGYSITGIKKYEKDTLIVFDIFDTRINNFLPYSMVYQYCYHYDIPVVKLFNTTRHTTLKDLNHFTSYALATCDAVKDYGKDEGMVVKAFRERYRCKDCGKEW